MDDSIQSDTLGVSKLVPIALLGLVGCAIIIVVNDPSKPITTARSIGTLVGLYFVFVGFAGIVVTVRNGGSLF